jgi:hypothetical protein
MEIQIHQAIFYVILGEEYLAISSLSYKIHEIFHFSVRQKTCFA